MHTPYNNQSFRGVVGVNGWTEFDAEEPYMLPTQGWKIHISSNNRESAKRIADAVIPFLENEENEWGKLNWKIRRNIYTISEGGTQAGKFITIYPKNLEHLRQILPALQQRLAQQINQGSVAKNDFAHIQDDLQIEKGRIVNNWIGGIYIRYGAYSGAVVCAIDPDNYTPADWIEAQKGQKSRNLFLYYDNPQDVEPKSKVKPKTSSQNQNACYTEADIKGVLVPDFMAKKAEEWGNYDPLEGTGFVFISEDEVVAWKKILNTAAQNLPETQQFQQQVLQPMKKRTQQPQALQDDEEDDDNQEEKKEQRKAQTPKDQQLFYRTPPRRSPSKEQVTDKEEEELTKSRRTLGNLRSGAIAKNKKNIRRMKEIIDESHFYNAPYTYSRDSETKGKEMPSSTKALSAMKSKKKRETENQQQLGSSKKTSTTKNLGPQFLFSGEKQEKPEEEGE